MLKTANFIFKMKRISAMNVGLNFISQHIPMDSLLHSYRPLRIVSYGCRFVL